MGQLGLNVLISPGSIGIRAAITREGGDKPSKIDIRKMRGKKTCRRTPPRHGRSRLLPVVCAVFIHFGVLFMPRLYGSNVQR